VIRVVVDRSPDQPVGQIQVPGGGSQAALLSQKSLDDLPDIWPPDNSSSTARGTTTENDAGMVCHANRLFEVALGHPGLAETLLRRLAIEGGLELRLETKSYVLLWRWLCHSCTQCSTAPMDQVIEHYKGEQLVERNAEDALWELMYFGKVRP
jgi:hypothetical protein